MEKEFKYIAVEGPIGAGKTSLTRLLSEHLGKEVLLEEPDSNPFLEEFYKNRQRYALAVQLNFFLRRVEQINQVKQMNLFHSGTVADFLIEKDPIFARLNLSNDELKLYRQIYDHLKPNMPVPDLVIYLQASPMKLIERVKTRGKVYERNVTKEYITSVFVEYQNFFHSYDSAPILIVNSDNLNFVDKTAHFDMLLERIFGMRSPREFFGLAG